MADINEGSSKYCPHCGKNKPLNAFYASGGYCKGCRAEYTRHWYNSLSPVMRKKMLERQKEKINKAKRNYYYRRKYGMTEEEYKDKKANVTGGITNKQ
jgi:hypothetical protein